MQTLFQSAVCITIMVKKQYPKRRLICVTLVLRKNFHKKNATNKCIHYKCYITVPDGVFKPLNMSKNDSCGKLATITLHN